MGYVEMVSVKGSSLMQTERRSGAHDVRSLGVLLLALLVFCPMHAGAKERDSVDGPSLEVTQKFISDTMGGCGLYKGQQVESKSDNYRIYYQMFLEKSAPDWQGGSHIFTMIHRYAEMRWMFDEKYHETVSHKGIEDFDQFDLELLSPEVTVTEAQGLFKINLYCTSGDCIFTRGIPLDVPPDADKTTSLSSWKLNKGGSLPPTRRSYIGYFLCNERVAQSLAKAFSHAIKKAGGKKPLF